MGVRINVSKTFKTKVEFFIQTGDGKPEPQSFIAEFKRLTREEVGELIESKAKDSEMVRQVLVGWLLKDIDTNEPIEFSKDNLEAFLAIPGAAGVTILKFFDVAGASREKN